MPNKIKIALTLVAVVAVFSVYELAQYIHAVANGGPVSVIASGSYQDTITCPTCDPDHDGLTNAEEAAWGTDPLNPDTDGDGFKDGEEVKSGHNPLIPGPNDLLSADNLTDQFSNLIVSGLYSGDLKPDSANYDQALTDITNSVTDSSKNAFANNADQPSIQTIQGNFDNKTLYLKQVGPLIRQFQDLLAEEYQNSISSLNTIGVNGFGDQSIKTFFLDQTSGDQTIKDKLGTLVVPLDFEPAHTQFLNLVQHIQDINTAIANGDIDPVKASAALNSFFDIYQNYVDVLKNYQDEITTQHLDMKLLDL